MPASTRLFFALWPDEGVRSEIAAAIASLEVSGRVTATGNLHVTLIFLGTCDSTRRDCVERAAASVVADAFEINLTQVQWRRNGGIAWLTTPEVPAALTQLVASLHVALESCGYEAERRPFRPHVTIARNARRFGGGRTISAITWRARDLCLVSSTLSSQGSDYAIVRRWPLVQGAALS